MSDPANDDDWGDERDDEFDDDLDDDVHEDDEDLDKAEGADGEDPEDDDLDHDFFGEADDDENEEAEADPVVMPQPRPPTEATPEAFEEALEAFGPAADGRTWPPHGTWLTIEQGDCLANVAAHYGMAKAKIWDHGDNADLAAKRHPSILAPGDKLFIPEIEPISAARPVDRRHVFKINRATVRIRIRILRKWTAMTVPFLLRAYETRVEGTTDTDGWLEATVPAQIDHGVLHLFFEDGTVSRRVRFGGLDPHDSEAGLRHRMRNLGYPYDGDDEERQRSRIRAFQQSVKLEVTGEFDAATKAKLLERHRS